VGKKLTALDVATFETAFIFPLTTKQEAKFFS